MGAKDLRIGDWVSEEVLGNGRVISISGNDVVIVEYNKLKSSGKIEKVWYTIDLCNLSPITLTEEWLLRFGFEKDGEYYSIHLFDYKYCLKYADFRSDWGFYIEYIDSPLLSDEDVKYFVSCGTKYVHQLQNLYCSLTGNELTFNE